jgi:hypothetical protein
VIDMKQGAGICTALGVAAAPGTVSAGYLAIHQASPAVCDIPFAVTHLEQVVTGHAWLAGHTSRDDHKVHAAHRLGQLVLVVSLQHSNMLCHQLMMNTLRYATQQVPALP